MQDTPPPFTLGEFFESATTTDESGRTPSDGSSGDSSALPLPPAPNPTATTGSQSALGAPTEITAKPSSSTIAPNWNDVPGAAGYKVQQRNRVGPGQSSRWESLPINEGEAQFNIIFGSVDTSSAVVSGLASGRWYYNRIRSTDYHSASNWSDWTRTSTPSEATPTVTPTQTAPHTPTATTPVTFSLNFRAEGLGIVADNDQIATAIETTDKDIRLNLNISVSATIRNKRAYVIGVEAKVSDEWVAVDSITNSEAGRLSNHEYLGFGQLVWIEDRRIERNITLDASAPGTPTEYRVTVSKPDYAFIEPIHRDLDTERDAYAEDRLVLRTKIYNSSDELPHSYALYEVYCLNPDTDGALNSHSGNFWGLDPNTSRQIHIIIVCEGVDLKDATFDVFMYLRGQNDCDLLTCPDISEHTIAKTITVNWDLRKDTVWSAKDPLVGGVQMTAETNGVGNPSLCSLSFPLALVKISDGSKIDAISSTGHCVGDNKEWWQGPMPLIASDRDVNRLGATLLPRPDTTSCNLNVSFDTTIERKANCYSGDQGYATSTISGIPSIMRPEDSRLEGDPLRFNHFVESSPDSAFTIVASRPPGEGEIANKVGRSTGWSAGGLIWASTDKDPECPGSELGTEDNGSESGGYHECFVHTTYASTHGDSGSPVFVEGDQGRVVLVGVHYGRKVADGVSVSKRFVPIDRVYAESLKRGYDWEPKELRAVPVIDSKEGLNNIERIFGNEDLMSVFARFEAKDLSSPVLDYKAALFKNTGTDFVRVSGVSEVSTFPFVAGNNDTRYAEFDLSGLSGNARSGTFHVAVRACVGAICGGYGSFGMGFTFL